MHMSKQQPDIIDFFSEIQPRTPLDLLRNKRPGVRLNAVKGHTALFNPENTGEMSLEERFAVAVFVSALHRHEKQQQFYGQKLGELVGQTAPKLSVLGEETTAALELPVKSIPYGTYPAGPHAGESQPGPTYAVSAAGKDVLGKRLSTALEHAHLLILHPRDARPEHLQRLSDAGWSRTGIITLVQVITFLAYQTRIINGLSTLARTRGQPVAGTATERSQS
jgi:CMD domain protein